jgi:aerobic carbon-monoxide dehydrogenase medium subunit
MIPSSFEYTRARTLSQALDALGRRGTKVVAGGQTLIPLLRFRMATPTRLVDISGVPQLQGIKDTPKGLRIGAATTYRDLLDSALVKRKAPLIAEVTGHIGDRQVRNLGTIGGGIAHPDPAADMPAVMLALGASFGLRSRRASRSVPASKYFLGLLTTALKPSELLVEIVVPGLARGAGHAYATFEQPASGYALVGAAAVVVRARGKVSSATLAFTGVGPCAFLADVSGLVGTEGTSRDIERVTKGLPGTDDINEDIHASAEYRAHLARVAAGRALARALERAK